VCFIVKNKGGERGGEDEKEKEKKKEGDSTLLQAMPSRRPRTENFSHKKTKKNSQNPSNTKKTHKNDFWFLVFFYWLVWFIFLGWVGFGFETPTANPDVTLPSPNTAGEERETLARTDRCVSKFYKKVEDKGKCREMCNNTSIEALLMHNGGLRLL